MKAMILAAGRGERMGAFTRATPKPLLEVHGKALIEYQIERLVVAGYHDIVINVAYLGEMIKARLGDGAAYGVNITYSVEAVGALGTGGGVRQALPHLGHDAIAIVNADVWPDYPYERLTGLLKSGVHLVLVPNPEHVPEGDFALNGNEVSRHGPVRHTFSGIAAYRPDLFAGRPGEAFSLVRVIDEAIERGNVTGELYKGTWVDVGTPERYRALLSAHRAV